MGLGCGGLVFGGLGFGGWLVGSMGVYGLALLWVCCSVVSKYLTCRSFDRVLFPDLYVRSS